MSEVSIYMQIDGIKGAVSGDVYKEWIALGHMSFGAGRAVSGASPGNVGDRTGAIPSFSEISISKSADLTTPYLFSEIWGNKSKKTVKIHLVQMTDGKPTPYLEIDLENVLFSGYSVDAGAGGLARENCLLNYDKITVRFTPRNPDQTPGTPINKGYDLKEAKPI